ncbi:marine proteobacterial sortase target protein [Aliikangiella maris]|uniref:Marine proteobacterial sortase target protein n=2 Tax=Aliikangiella maris TaxID=3162458 RepID=A0ABV3MSL5_9GAMM
MENSKLLFQFNKSWFYIFLLCCAGISFSALAKDSEVAGGQLKLKNSKGSEFPALTMNTQVQIDVAGMMARSRLTQIFTNPSTEWVEGTYLFPLPEKSAVDHLTIKIGERLIVGEIQEKHQARKNYEAAKKAGKKASLVEQQRANIFSNQVANIAPGETIEVMIEYQQDLTFDLAEGFSLRFPLTITPRYTPLPTLVEEFSSFEQGLQTKTPAKQLLQPAFVEPDSAINQVSIQVNLNSGVPVDLIKSDSHEIDILPFSDSQYRIELSSVKQYKADRDFLIRWKPVQGAAPKAAIFSEIIENEKFVSLMIMPPQQEQSIDLARELIFILDISGSMAGESIEQAKKALLFGLNTLNDGELFNLIVFNNHARSLFQDAQVVNQKTKAQARAYVQELVAEGGTEMLSAMQLALTGETQLNRIRQVVFLTDGAINNESALFQKIANDLGDSRLFTVGIGSAPNAFFMKRAAQFGRGSFTFVANTQDSESKMRQLFSQISSPTMSNLMINWQNGIQAEIWPKRIPDLYLGEPLWIKAKVSDLNGALEINGQMSNAIWQTTINLSSASEQKGVSQLWAREKIASIMNEHRHGNVPSDAKQTIVDTAIKHHLVSRFTSLVAIDKTPARVIEKLHEQIVPSILPKGSQLGGFQFAKTSIHFWLAPSKNWLLLIAATLLFACSQLIRLATSKKS